MFGSVCADLSALVRNLNLFLQIHLISFNIFFFLASAFCTFSNISLTFAENLRFGCLAAEDGKLGYVHHCPL